MYVKCKTILCPSGKHLKMMPHNNDDDDDDNNYFNFATRLVPKPNNASTNSSIPIQNC